MSLCIEKKMTLSGKVSFFECELLYFDTRIGVLKYVISENYAVENIKLQPGDITYALYWTERPYTLYVWHVTGRRSPVYYFNIADSIALNPTVFAWRDLSVDIVIEENRDPVVLDEDELPRNLDHVLSQYIQSAKSIIIEKHRTIIQEAEALLKRVHDI